MLRWTIRILLLFVVLVLVAAVVVHLVLTSAWLDKTVLARISERTGMAVEAESLSIGWGGGTTLRAVTVKMPLSGAVFLTADTIRLKHETIPLLILGRPFHLRSVRVDSPEVYLRQDDNGRWNVQDVWMRLKARNIPRDPPKRRTPLPQVGVHDARVQITEPNGASQTLGPLEFVARPEGLRWQFDLNVPAVAAIQGRVLSGGDWAHDIGFAFAGIGPLVRHISGNDLSPIEAAGRWEGKVVPDGLSGTLHLDELAAGPVAARGNVSVRAEAGRITIRPQGLTFSEPNLAGQEIRLTAGVVRFEDARIHVEQLAAASSLLAARVDGNWDWIAREGECAGSWTTASAGQSSPVQGTYRAAVKASQLGRKTARVSVTAQAEDSFGAWAVAADAEGGGAAWGQSQWQVSMPRLVWSRKGKTVDLTGSRAEIHVAWPEIGLTALHLRQAKTTAVGQFDASTRRWSLHVAAEDVSQLKPWGLESVSFQVNAEGDDRKAYIAELRVAEGAKTIVAKGELSLGEKGFQNIRVTADWPVGALGSDRAEGHWHLEGDAFGRIEPLSGKIVGQLTGRNIALGKQQLNRVEIPVQASADERWVRVTTDPFGLLGGVWRLTGQYDLATAFTQLGVTADDLSMEAAAGIAGLSTAPPQYGVSRPRQGRARAQLQVAMSGFDFERAVATGDWSAEDVNIPPFRAERARGRLRIGDGLVRFDETTLEQEAGQARLNLEFPLDNPQALTVDLTADRWPVRFEDRPVSIVADGQARLRVNVARRTAAGEADIAARVRWQEQDLADVRVAGLVQGQTLDIRGLHVETLGGAVDGQAVIPLDHPPASTAKLGWRGIQPSLLGQWVSPFERFEGTVSGTLVVERAAPASRPPEPTRFELTADVENGRFGPAQVGDWRVVGFLGDRRLLIDGANFRLLDGQLQARSRVSIHEGRHFGSIALDFNDLKLNQLVHAIDPNAAEHWGNLAGAATVLIAAPSGGQGLSSWPSLQGEARVNLTQSDLAGNSVIRTLYNTFSLQFGQQEPTGTGDVIIRLEGHSVSIPSFTYFNRGIEIRGAWRIEDFHRGGASPVSGFAVASTRVLKGIQLPGVRELDQLLATLQAGATSVKIGGTLEKVEVNVVPLPEVLGAFRRLLWTQLHE